MYNKKERRECDILFWVQVQYGGCSKKNQNAPRPSEHPPVRGGNVKTLLCSSHIDRASTIYPVIYIRGCQSGMILRGLLDKKISEECLQSSNESMTCLPDYP